MTEDDAAREGAPGAWRGRRSMVALAVAAIAAAAVPLGAVWLTAGSPSGAAPVATAEIWRWESYGGIEVRVPSVWGTVCPLDSGARCARMALRSSAATP